MIRNLIAYSEYRVQRSNLVFWDRLNIKLKDQKTWLTNYGCHVIFETWSHCFYDLACVYNFV